MYIVVTNDHLIVPWWRNGNSVIQTTNSPDPDLVWSVNLKVMQQLNRCAKFLDSEVWIFSILPNFNDTLLH